MTSKRPKETATSFMNPSGKVHMGRTYANFYSEIEPPQELTPEWFNVLRKQQNPAIEGNGKHVAPSWAKTAPSRKSKPRHQHDWLERHDYMQCKTCGKFVENKKERGSVDK